MYMFVIYLLEVLSCYKMFSRQTYLQQNGVYDCELLCIKTLKVVFRKYCSFWSKLCRYKQIPNKSVPFSVVAMLLLLYFDHHVISSVVKLITWPEMFGIKTGYRALPATLTVRIVESCKKKKLWTYRTPQKYAHCFF